MDKIISVKEAIAISSKLKSKGKTIVLAGGCFDILHVGHVSFLRKAKEQGDTLFVLLESDSRIRKIKGENRPINSQKNRAMILSEFSCVDYIVFLPELKTNKEYDNLINAIKPDIIATTKGDPNMHHKKRQTNMVGAKLIEVIERIYEQSTSKLLELISKEKL